MNFQPLLGSAQPIMVHAMAAMLAVGLGGVQFVPAKRVTPAPVAVMPGSHQWYWLPSSAFSFMKFM